MLYSLFTSAILASSLVAAAAVPVDAATPTTSAIATIPTTVPASTCTNLTPAEVTALQQKLALAPSTPDRQAILFPNPPSGCNYAYQFINQTVKPPTGGSIVLAGVDQVPGLLGTSIGFAVGFVNACGLNVPHSHPRANEFLTVIEGQLIGGLILEAAEGGNPSTPGPLPMITNTLQNFTGMLFPQGDVHFQFNPTCKPAVFAAGFDNIDPGRTQIARTFLSVMPDELLLTATGGVLDPTLIGQLRNKIPNEFAELIDSCAKRCGITTA